MERIVLPFEQPAVAGPRLASSARANSGRASRAMATRERRDQPEKGYAETIRNVLGVAAALKVEILSFSDAALRETEWHDLASRVLEKNIFFEPAFALAAARHLPEAGRPFFAFISEDSNSSFVRGQLCGIIPFTVSRLDIGVPVLRIWQHANSAIATPLLDGTRAQDALTAFFDFVEETRYSSIFFAKMPLEGAFAQLLGQVIESRDCNKAVIIERKRAMLSLADGYTAETALHWSSKKLKGLRRLRRRLAEIAPLFIRVQQKSEEISPAIERFLKIEAGGWKGDNGTALVQQTGRATFARAMMRGFSRQGQVEVHELYSGDTLVASGIVLRSGTKAYYWKIAHDERFARFSPGVLLTQEITCRNSNLSRLDSIDSCAVQDHPMIDRMWHGRMGIGDWLVSVTPNSPVAFAIALRREKWRRALRENLRSLVIRLRRGKNN